MKHRILLLVLAGLSTLFLQCSKDGDSTTPPTPSKLTISNLNYNPKTIVYNSSATTFIVNGYFSYANAQGGVYKLRLTSSAGTDVTQIIQDNVGASSGTITGAFEFQWPATLGTINFEVWVIDAKGNASNKLSGSIQLIIDDSAVKWRYIAIETPSMLQDVAWLDEQFIAVGNAGGIMTSPNGSQWTFRNTGINNLLRGIAWSGTTYVAVGENSAILSSPDGETWTNHSVDSIPDVNLTDIVWTGTAFVAVGGSTSKYSGNILNSTDGKTWTINPFSITKGFLTGVANSGSLMVPIGKADGHPIMVTSPDGINWTPKTIPAAGDATLYDVNWNGSQWLVSGSGFVLTSPDGNVWTYKLLAGNPNLSKVIHTGNKYVAAGGGIYTSNDGNNWTLTYTGDSYYPFLSIAWSGNNYVAVGLLYAIAVSP